MKIIKKIISVSLCLLICISFCAVGFVTQAAQTCPVIYIPGIMASAVYADASDEETRLSFPDSDELIALAQDVLVPALITFSADRDADKLALTLSQEANEIFADWFNESTGDTKSDSGPMFDYTQFENINAESKLTFEYDWRADPLVVAAELDAFIDYVIEKSGCDKVALTCHSLGSCVLLSYTALYGTEKIEAVVVDTPACNGAAIVGNLLTGELIFDSQIMGDFLKSILGQEDYEELIASLIDVFELAEIPEMFTLFIDSIIEELSPVLYKETIGPLFAYWPSMWAMVPDEKLDEAMEYIFDDLLADEDLTVLRARVELYNTLVRDNKEALFKELDEGRNFAVISRYGSYSYPLVETSGLIGDSVLETTYSSLGADTAPAGTYFSEEETEGVDEKYISPDRTINASTCLFPEKTWFIKNCDHAQTRITRSYHNMFLFAEEELTTETAELGRFSYYDEATGTIIEDTTEPEKAEEPTALERLFNFLKSLFKNAVALLKKLFSK